MFSGTSQVSHQVCEIFVSSVCLLVRVAMVDKNEKAVVFCLLATSAIMISKKKKRSVKSGVKNWYVKRDICVSCDVHLLNELLEMDVL